METNAITIDWAGERLTLLPERALWWQREKTLFIADPHFGKAATFRVAGIAAPEIAHHDDLDRLEKLLRSRSAKRLVILGDFFHAKAGRSPAVLDALADWRSHHADLEITLISGNHDRHAGPPPVEWNIRSITEPWKLAPFLCCHEPRTVDGRFVLSGHWHPSFRLNEATGSGLHSPCFYFTSEMAVLPAFGSFTGLQPVAPKPKERIFLIGPGEIIEVENCHVRLA